VATCPANWRELSANYPPTVSSARSVRSAAAQGLTGAQPAIFSSSASPSRRVPRSSDSKALAIPRARSTRQATSVPSAALPFSSVKTGPAKDLGLGPDFRIEACLDQILQRLQKFPGVGWEAIEVGLNCRVTRTRNMALRALAEWPRSDWPSSADPVLSRLLFQEPDDKVRQRVRELLGAT